MTASWIFQVYQTLYQRYQAQGWWPLLKTGYTPQNYRSQLTWLEQYEIYLGAILTQNTTWRQAEQALSHLQQLCGKLDPHLFLKASPVSIKQAITPAHYFNQKLIYLTEATHFFIHLKQRTPQRAELLAVKGIGQETADCILLYAYQQPEFVIDAYTFRIFSKFDQIENHHYATLKQKITHHIPKNWQMYQEFHALLVKHGHLYYQRKPYGINDDLLNDL